MLLQFWDLICFASFQSRATAGQLKYLVNDVSLTTLYPSTAKQQSEVLRLKVDHFQSQVGPRPLIIEMIQHWEWKTTQPAWSWSSWSKRWSSTERERQPNQLQDPDDPALKKKKTQPAWRSRWSRWSSTESERRPNRLEATGLNDDGFREVLPPVEGVSRKRPPLLQRGRPETSHTTGSLFIE